MKPPPPRLPIVLMEPNEVKPAENPTPVNLCALISKGVSAAVSHQDQRGGSQHQMKEIQNLQKRFRLFSRDPLDRGGAGCRRRTGRHQNGQDLREEEGTVQI